MTAQNKHFKIKIKCRKLTNKHEQNTVNLVYFTAKFIFVSFKSTHKDLLVGYGAHRMQGWGNYSSLWDLFGNHSYAELCSLNFLHFC